jgi:hypothetical protein
MKRSAYIYGIILLVLAVTSCSDDFLDRNNADWYGLSDTLLLDNFNTEATVMFELPEKINSGFIVFSRPKWLSVESPRGKVESGRVEFPLSIDGSNLPEGYFSHSGMVLVQVEDFGFVSFTVIFTNYGLPSIQCTPSSLLFDGTTTQQFSITTPTEGILDWVITDIPEWLSFSETSGTLWHGQSAWLIAYLDAGKITPGTQVLDTVRISSPHAQYPFLLSIRVTPATVPPPQGFTLGSILMDAEYHHDSGLMAVCTKSPNQLILFNTVSQESDTIALEKTPACISISADGHKAVIGYTVASVSYIDLDTFEITADYDIDCIPFDIVLGETGWCYITPTEDQWVYMRNLNLTTGQVSTNSYQIYEQTLIRKVPAEDYMVGSSLGLSPSGLMVFDLTEGAVNPEVTKYHESIGHFWLSKDGTKVYCAYGKIYWVPEYVGSSYGTDAPVFGNFNLNYSCITSLDDCPAISSVFYSTSSSWYQPGTSPLIEQFNSTNLNKIKSYNVSPALVSIQGTMVPYETTPRFIFVNKEGTRMHVLKVLKPDYDIEGWLFETITL